MIKKSLSDPYKSQFKTLQEILKHVRYHADMFYLDNNVLYCHSFLDFEEVLFVLEPGVDLSAYNGIYGHVGDVYDGIADMRKTRINASINEKIPNYLILSDEKVGSIEIPFLPDSKIIKEGTEYAKIRDQFLSGSYKNLPILEAALSYEYDKFTDQSITDIHHGLSYDLILESPRKIITLAKEGLPLIEKKELFYAECKEFESDDLFYITIKKKDEYASAYILLSAFLIPE